MLKLKNAEVPGGTAPFVRSEIRIQRRSMFDVRCSAFGVFLRFRPRFWQLALCWLFCFFPFRLPACGPYFPNNLLNRGDDAVLVAPIADFKRELQRMRIAPEQFQAVPATNGYANQTAAAELDDLLAALNQSGTPDGIAREIIARHQAERTRLLKYVEARGQWQSTASLDWDESVTNFVRGTPLGAAPAFPKISVTGNLPAEFADYFAGAVAWENPGVTNKAPARDWWKRVLELPPNQRRFKSTWAAFMLGKSWMETNPGKAIACFSQVRDLAKEGFMDSCGLAAASLGLEAQLNLRQGNFECAIELYLDQMATGDETAINSLRFTASRALEEGDAGAVSRLAANLKTQRVITAYLISARPDPTKDPLVKTWLAAAESANVKDMDSAEELALAAYQSGEWTTAQRWIDRASSMPVAQWLEAKLLLRSGKIREAAAMLAKVAPHFPLVNNETNIPVELQDDLSVPYETDAAAHVLGEIGVLHLARREYIEALDALMRAGFWMDAAYVAERVLSADELKSYVDENWPATVSEPDSTEPRYDGLSLRMQIRFLLARRLARLHRDDEARQYYPPEWLPQFDALNRALAIGRNESLSNKKRAKALFAAAMMTRTNGMELLGTEVEPDWHIYGGYFDEGVSRKTRTNYAARWLVPTSDELRRAAQHGVEPNERFHYRFEAADLAFEAAKLMPDNSDATARVLCTAGSWIKYRDPKKADPIYKALVRRCGKTAIGQQADQMRWFPILDADGDPIPYRPRIHPGRRSFHLGTAGNFG